MKFRERLAGLNRLQHGRWFAIVASLIVLGLGAAALTSYVVVAAAAPGGIEIQEPSDSEKPKADVASLKPEERAEYEAALAEFEARQAAAHAVKDVLSARADTTAAGVGIAIIVTLSLAVIWSGLGLTGLGIALAVGAVCWPLVRYGNPFWSGVGRFAAAVGLLTFAFVVLMEALRGLLRLSNPASAVARNVVIESVRMKVSLVFIVLLLLALAALPALLDESTPLRYRVQSFLQWGTGGTFWIIALLTVFLAVGTVAFEQRDKIIWQTATKPVSAWQYLFGKWLGVAGVAAVLLGVSTAGVFMFTEYLRAQQAQGEVEPYVAARGALLTEDRQILETQVLAARMVVGPKMPVIESDSLKEELDRRTENAKKTDSSWRDTAESRAVLETDLRNEIRTAFLAIDAGKIKRYEFRGLEHAKAEGKPLTLRYKCDVGANDPRQTIRVTLAFPNAAPRVFEVPLGQMMTAPVLPNSIDPNGVLSVEVVNGDVYRDAANPKPMSFPPDGLQIAYAAGSYRANFMRVMGILWLKLAFLAMVGVVSATFLSFSVASLVSFGVFFIAESTRFLNTSLDAYASMDAKGNIDFFKMLVRALAVPVNEMFRFYGDLTPTSDLVDGRLLGWITLLKTLVVMLVVCGALFGVGVVVFRSRELATYSGQ